MKTELDNQTKQLLQEVAGITGVDIKLINTVLENLLIAWLLKILKESPEKKLVTIPIPYIGNIGIRYNLSAFYTEENMDSLVLTLQKFLQMLTILSQ